MPQTPTGLTASQGADQAETELVKLNWIGNPDIGQLSTSEPYIIYRSETSGTGYKQIGTSKTNSYIDSQSSLVPGKVYYYVIAAKDVVGNISAFSA